MYIFIIIAYIHTNVVDCLVHVQHPDSTFSFNQAEKVLRVDIISVARIMQLPESCQVCSACMEGCGSAWKVDISKYYVSHLEKKIWQLYRDQLLAKY